MSRGNAARNAESFGDSLWTITYSLRGTDLPHLQPLAQCRRSSITVCRSSVAPHRPSPIAHRPSPIARQSHPDDRMAMSELTRPVSSALSPSRLFVPGCGRNKHAQYSVRWGGYMGGPSLARCFPKPRYLKCVNLFDYLCTGDKLSPNDGGPIPNTAPASSWFWFPFARTHRLVRVDAVGSLDLHDVRGADCLCGPSFPWLRHPPQILLSERQRQSLPRPRHGPPLALRRCPGRRRSRRSAPRARATRYGRLVPFDPVDPVDPVAATGLVGAQGEHHRGHLAHCKRRVSGGAHDARVQR